jgi:hypothetical protein
VILWVRQLHYDESENATDDWSESNMLGSDCFGVQHGSLKQAVKRRSRYNNIDGYLVQSLSSSNVNPHFAPRFSSKSLASVL